MSDITRIGAVTDLDGITFTVYMDHGAVRIDHGHTRAFLPVSDAGSLMEYVGTAAVKALMYDLEHAADDDGQDDDDWLEMIRWYEGPGSWDCTGCGAHYTGHPDNHLYCPMRVKPLTGGIGVFGTDWTFYG